jgi:hypothetical protein
MSDSQMIDEVHTLIGAGAAEGAIDAANILKPALARGELQCIGATTLDEYRKHIEKDPALERCVACWMWGLQDICRCGACRMWGSQGTALQDSSLLEVVYLSSAAEALCISGRIAAARSTA